MTRANIERNGEYFEESYIQELRNYCSELNKEIEKRWQEMQNSNKESEVGND